MKPETIKQVVAIARTCGVYKSTSVKKWIEHMVVLSTEDHLEVAMNGDEVLGFMTWVRVAKPARVEFEDILQDINKGDYIGIMLACVKNGVEDGRRILKDLRDKVIDKAPGAKHLAWVREKYDNRISIHPIKRRAA